MATAGLSAFQLFKDKCSKKKNQKKENVENYLNREKNKRKQQQEEKAAKAAEESKGKNKKRKRKHPKKREEKEAERDAKLNQNVKRNVGLQRADVKKLEKMGSERSAGGGFMAHAQKKFDSKMGTKRKREEESDEEDDDDDDKEDDQKKSELETIFGKSVDKVQPGTYQHNRILITQEKMEAVVESTKTQRKEKNKRRRSNEAENKLERKKMKEDYAVENAPTGVKSILKNSGTASEPRPQIEEAKMKDEKLAQLSTIPGWRTLPAAADSADEGRKAFQWLISPVEPKRFFAKLWEKKPLLVKRKNDKYNNGWFSTSELDLILRKNSLLFGENIDVVTYSRSGKRETHNQEGRAYASVVWDYYQQGCSVRLLNPQTYSSRCWKMLSTLQEFFGCFVGANVYLTPPGSQGFAPHYDDIEAFVLQLEGKKHWRLYDPRSKNESLPRLSSPNFEQSDLGECILDTVLEPGDLLYFPRGIIHQADTQDENHSLHVTVSTYQKTAWADLFEKMIPQALAISIEDDDSEFRRGLPVGYLNHMGISNQDRDSVERQQFLKTVSSLFDKLKEAAMVDAGVDQMAKQFVYDSLPPCVGEEESRRSCRMAGEHWKDGRVGGVVELDPDTQVKLLRKHVLRLVMENDSVWVFYSADNLRTYHVRDPMCFEIAAEQAENVERLIQAYPDFVKIDDLPVGTLDEKITTITALYDRSLVLTKESLDTNCMYSDDDISSDDLEELDKVLVVENGEEEESSDDEDVPPEPVKIDGCDDDYDKE